MIVSISIFLYRKYCICMTARLSELDTKQLQISTSIFCGKKKNKYNQKIRTIGDSTITNASYTVIVYRTYLSLQCNH